MKALILSAGLGTRLRPFTEFTPKPLFSINGQTLLDRIIFQLYTAGCTAIMVNTHHLHDKVKAHVTGQLYPIPVLISHEPEILGTGGAIRHVKPFWDDAPFWVINCDILTDIDFRAVYAFHCHRDTPVTLVLIDAPEFNTVAVGPGNTIVGFGNPDQNNPPFRKLTFTGIQVLNPTILDLIPEGRFVHSIDVYRDLIAAGTPPSAYIATKARWEDLGTPDRFRKEAFRETAPEAFQKANGNKATAPIQKLQLAGDGSDRKWYRLKSEDRTLVMVDHGIRQSPSPSEVDAFIAIGNHLKTQGVRVPEIFGYDDFSGFVFLEDLGDIHLQDVIKTANSLDITLDCYQSVIDQLIHMSISGIKGFDPAWTYQSTHYDRSLILERECRYFVDAFLNGWLQMETRYDDLAAEFNLLADGVLSNAVMGFMHRDFQSRNIMIHNDLSYLIDFQGARIGPIQYDLASLLIDPYVQLPKEIQSSLLEYAMEKISEATGIKQKRCLLGYRHCAVTRNLQMLGAFGYLSRVKGKPHFSQYIPAAVTSLDRNLNLLGNAPVDELRHVVDRAMQRISPGLETISKGGRNEQTECHG